MKKPILLVSIMLLTTVTVIAQKRLVVPYQGTWNYAITNIEIYPNRCFTTEKIQIHSKIKCLESSNRSGFIRCRIEIRNQKIRNYIEIQDLNLYGPNNEITVTFSYFPPFSGNYEITVSVWGGFNYLWQFDQYNFNLNVFDRQTTHSSREKPAGLTIYKPFKRNHFTIYTFELNRDAVRISANNLGMAKRYIEYIIWRIANDRWDNIDLNILIACSIAIGIESEKLHAKARELYGQPLQAQYECNDQVLPYIDMLRDIENILSSMKMLYGYHMLQNLPVIY